MSHWKQHRCLRRTEKPTLSAVSPRRRGNCCFCIILLFTVLNYPPLWEAAQHPWGCNGIISFKNYRNNSLPYIYVTLFICKCFANISSSSSPDIWNADKGYWIYKAAEEERGKCWALFNIKYNVHNLRSAVISQSYSCPRSGFMSQCKAGINDDSTAEFQECPSTCGITWNFSLPPVHKSLWKRGCDWCHSG